MDQPDREVTTDSPCSDPCCHSDEEEADATPKTDRWLDGNSVLDSTLPTDLQRSLGLLLGEDSVETLADWIDNIRQMTGEGSIGIADLCHTSTVTGHWGELDGKRYDFLCFYDAVILAALADEPVDIRTESPGGSIVRANAAGTTDLTVQPAEAVFSFGIDDAPPQADGDPSPEDIYAAVCPYVRAFPNRDAYLQWADSVSAATIGMPLLGATELARALVK